MPRKGFESVNIPQRMSDAIEEVLKERPELGYRSKDEFVRTAIREHLHRYSKYVDLEDNGPEGDDDGRGGDSVGG